MELKAQATQSFVPIKEVRDGIVVLKDGGLRAVIAASSINLSLKSADEQQAILLQFQTFLNSLDFSTQIVVQSRELDIRPYLLLLEERLKVQVEPLLKIQTREYIGFIRQFTEENSIMKKSFFLSIPYTAAPLSRGGSITKKFFGKKEKKSGDKDKQSLIDFEEKRNQLEQRISVVEQGLARVGVRTVQLGTEEVVELFYKIFNPGEITNAAKMGK